MLECSRIKLLRAIGANADEHRCCKGGGRYRRKSHRVPLPPCFVRADVTSAQPLADAQRKTLETEISRVAGKKAKLKFATDPALVGGVVARIGSTVYDGSVRGQLDGLRAMLAKG